MSKDQEDVGRLVAKSSYKGSKNPKGSARSKYNRRKLWLAHALHQMEIAIDALLAQDGAVYKRQEIDMLKRAIGEFTNVTGLRPPELASPTQEELDGFMDMLENLKPWQPPSKEELAALYASVELDVLPVDED